MLRNASGRIVGEYATLIPEEFQEAMAEQAIIYLPMGAIEWHNNHLPFNTDSLIAEGLCRRLAEETGGLLLPTNSWATGCTFNKGGPYPFEHSVGTVALFDPELHYRLLSRITRGVIDNGFRRLVILAGHVGKDDRDSMERITGEINASGDAKAVFLHPYLHTQGDHAGHWETLMLMGISPTSVRTGKGYTPCSFGQPLDGRETAEAGRDKINQLVNILRGQIENFFSPATETQSGSKSA